LIKKLLKIRLKRDPCIVIFDLNNNIECILTVYVDHILIEGTSPEVEIEKRMIKDKFNIKDISEIDFVTS